MYKIPANTVFIGKRIHYLPRCHSTNQIATELIKEGVEDGTVVITDDQFEGRGQVGNTWESAPEANLTFSIIHFPEGMEARSQFELTKVVTLGITDHLLRYLNIEATIKWPNDILYREKKLAGILINNTVNKNLIEESIMGIGLNVNQEKFTIPTATSLKLVTGREYNLQNVLNGLLDSIETRLIQLREGNARDLLVDYLHRLYGINESRLFKDRRTNTPFHGTIRGVDETGHLKVESEGRSLKFGFRELRFLTK